MAPDEQSIVDVHLHQPSATSAARFKALIRDFQLEAVEVLDSLQQETGAGSSAAWKEVNVRRFRAFQSRSGHAALEALQQCPHGVVRRLAGKGGGDDGADTNTE
jgi:hypothetical protein